MEESQYKQEHNKKVAQDEGQEDKDTIFETIEAIEAKLMELKTNPESTFNYGIFTEVYMNQGEEILYPAWSLKEENLFQTFKSLRLFQKLCPRGSGNLVKKSWYPCVPEEGGHIINIQDLFGPNRGTHKKPQLVIIEGAAGIGKSTLARQVKRAWKEGQLYRNHFQHVFFLSCRELAQYEQLSLAELITQGQDVPTAPINQILSHPEKLLFILDGIDEPAWVLADQNPELCLYWSQTQPVHTLLGSLLGKSILPEASFLLTTRTTALQKFIPSLPQSCQVEVLGFSDFEQEIYIYKYFAKQIFGIKALMMVESNPVLLTLCEVPWVCWLVCNCLKKQMEQGGDVSLTSQTTTAICLKYISLTIPVHHMRTQLRALCSLAAEGIWKRRTLFSESDLCKQGLDEDAVAIFLKTGVLQKQASSLSYSFAHLCLQEFFASMSCILEDSEERHGDMEMDRIVETLVERYGRQNLFEAPTVRFLFGLLSKEGLKEMEKLFSCSLPGKTKLKLLWHILGKSQPHQPPCLGLLHCLYENQDMKLLTHVMHDLQGTIVPDTDDITHTVLQTNVKHLVVRTDMELMVVTFCIQFCSHMRSLQLNMEGQQGYALTAPRMVLLDLYSLSAQVITELRTLEENNLKLHISSIWMPQMMVPTENMDEEDILTSFKQQRQQSGANPMEILGTEEDFWGPIGPVATEVVYRERNLYRVQLPMAGSYHCPSTRLHFVVTRAVTIEIEFCAWSQFLDKTPLQQSHMVVGPLFDIKAEQGAVTAVYLPHFVSLKDTKASTFDFKVAHFQEHGMVLETPDRVKPGYTVLKNPSFSPMGVVLRIIPAARHFIPITSITLIYYRVNQEEVTLHLYLVPNDCTIQKAIDDEEMKFQFVRINKPPPVDNLFIGSRYIVSGSENLEITPKELELCYRSSKEFQLFSEIYVGNMGSEIKLQIKNKKHMKLIWEALLKPGDLRPALPRIAQALKDAPSLLHFMDQHREQLVARVTSVDPLLDKLHGLVLNEESYEAVRAENTNQDKMRKLFNLSRSWSRACKDLFYQALKETHPHLVMDLLEKSGGVSLGS